MRNDSEMTNTSRSNWDICLVGEAAELPVTSRTVGYASFSSRLFLVLLLLSSFCFSLMRDANSCWLYGVAMPTYTFKD